jgi:DNA anti-recombination protein RmuC
MEEYMARQEILFAHLSKQQATNHAELMDRQATNHAELMDRQETLLAENNAKQAKQQATNHAELMDRQATNHAELMDRQETLLAENNAKQAKQQATNHAELMDRQESLHAENNSKYEELKQSLQDQMEEVHLRMDRNHDAINRGFRRSDRALEGCYDDVVKLVAGVEGKLLSNHLELRSAVARMSNRLDHLEEYQIREDRVRRALNR